MMATKLRDARPEDAPFLAEVLEMAGRGHLPLGPWDFTFPDAAERRKALERIAAGDLPSWCHRSVFRVAEIVGEPGAAMVSFVAGAETEATLQRAVLAVFTGLGWTPERMMEASARIDVYSRCFPDMPHGTWIVENVGTRPAARRRGLVRALLEDALERGRRSGHHNAQISCLIGNDPAQLAYERAGFRIVEERRDAEFERLIGAPGFSRMTLTL